MSSSTSVKIAAPENVVSGLLEPLAGAGRHKPGLVSRLDPGNTHEIMERDTNPRGFRAADLFLGKGSVDG
jgi:hypothetical protein